MFIFNHNPTANQIPMNRIRYLTNAFLLNVFLFVNTECLSNTPSKSIAQQQHFVHRRYLVLNLKGKKYLLQGRGKCLARRIKN